MKGPGRFLTIVARRAAGVLLPMAIWSPDVAAQVGAAPLTTGIALYRAACASCHGADGSGAPSATVGFDVPLPDLTSCSFATREADSDWFAVVHDGGPVRGFDPMMPAFGDALTDAQIQQVLDYVRTLCGSAAWPRGELNLPRPLVTEKAYPEDEAVVVLGAPLEGPAGIDGELVFERRFGARNQLEVVLPFGATERAPGRWSGGIGDLAVGVKRAFYHSLPRGTIVSATAEAILPTGDEDDGRGRGVLVFEPFVSAGQLLPANAFLQGQAGLELPVTARRAEREGFWRLVLGASVQEGRFGRTWSPMVELLGARAFEGGATTAWDVVPQLQVTLNTRQHVIASAGVRLPLTKREERRSEVLLYLLWDWFDGGFLEGW